MWTPFIMTGYVPQGTTLHILHQKFKKGTLPTDLLLNGEYPVQFGDWNSKGYYWGRCTEPLYLCDLPDEPFFLMCLYTR